MNMYLATWQGPAPPRWQWVTSSHNYVPVTPAAFSAYDPPSVWDSLRAATRALEAALLERAAA